jgi:hypothetical protein
MRERIPSVPIMQKSQSVLVHVLSAESKKCPMPLALLVENMLVDKRRLLQVKAENSCEGKTCFQQKHRCTWS